MTMNLNDLSINECIDVIVSASMVVELPNLAFASYPDSFLFFKYPDLKHRMMANCIFNRSTEYAKTTGLLSKEDMEKELVDRGVFTEEDNKRIEFIEKQIKAQQILLSKMKFAKDKIESLKKRISKLENDLSILRSKKEVYMINTAEAMASQEKLDYLVWATVFDFSEHRVWDTFDAYMNETDLVFKNTVYSLAIDFLYGFDMKKLRYIARHPEWRIRYTAFIKGNFKLFDTSPKDYTKDQLGLLHWSGYYQSIYEMMPDDRPDDDIIDDDAKLDDYMEKYFKRIEQERKISRASNKGADAFDRDEVIVTRFNELYEELEYDKVKPVKDTDKPMVQVGIKG